MATDDVKILRMLWLFFGLTYYSATYFYANELENSSQPEMKHPKLEKGKRSQGSVFIQNKLLALAFSLNKLVFLVVLLCIGQQMWILQFSLILSLMLILLLMMLEVLCALLVFMANQIP